LARISMALISYYFTDSEIAGGGDTSWYSTRSRHKLHDEQSDEDGTKNGEIDPFK